MPITTVIQVSSVSLCSYGSYVWQNTVHSNCACIYHLPVSIDFLSVYCQRLNNFYVRVAVDDDKDLSADNSSVTVIGSLYV